MGNRHSSSKDKGKNLLWRRLVKKIPAEEKRASDGTAEEVEKLVHFAGKLHLGLVHRKKLEELQEILQEDVNNNEQSKFYVGSANSTRKAVKRFHIHYERFTHRRCEFEPTFYVVPVGSSKRVCCKESALLAIGRGKLVHQKRHVSRNKNKKGYVYLVDTGRRELVPKRHHGYGSRRKWERKKEGDEPEKTAGYDQRREWEENETVKFEKVALS